MARKHHGHQGIVGVVPLEHGYTITGLCLVWWTGGGGRQREQDRRSSDFGVNEGYASSDFGGMRDFGPPGGAYESSGGGEDRWRRRIDWKPGSSIEF